MDLCCTPWPGMPRFPRLRSGPLPHLDLLHAVAEHAALLRAPGCAAGRLPATSPFTWLSTLAEHEGCGAARQAACPPLPLGRGSRAA
eukprot:8624431-Alexandrium_andersonii.AAC.1